MTIYFFLLIVAILLCVARPLFKSNENLIAILFLLLIAFIGFARDISVGTDNLIYSWNFKFTDFNPGTWSYFTEFEPGFNYLIAFFKKYISDDYFLFMGLLYIFWIFVFYRLTTICQVGYVYPIFIALCLGWFTNTPYNIMRQIFALSLYMFILPQLLDGKKILYIVLCIAIGFLFHRSIIALSLLVLFDNKLFIKLIQNKKNVIIVLAVSYVFVFLKRPINNLLNDYLSFFQFLGDRYVGYISHAEYEEESISKIGALINTFMACFTVYSLDKTQKLYSLYILFILCGVLFNNILGGVFVIFMRIATNFTWIYIYCYTAILNMSKGLKGIMIKSMIIFYCLFMYIYALVKNYGDIVPYVIRVF